MAIFFVAPLFHEAPSRDNAFSSKIDFDNVTLETNRFFLDGPLLVFDYTN
jgi:hypothetical protein